jgi:hypothetical protein
MKRTTLFVCLLMLIKPPRNSMMSSLLSLELPSKMRPEKGLRCIATWSSSRVNARAAQQTQVSILTAQSRFSSGCDMILSIVFSYNAFRSIGGSSRAATHSALVLLLATWSNCSFASRNLRRGQLEQYVGRYWSMCRRYHNIL